MGSICAMNATGRFCTALAKHGTLLTETMKAKGITEVLIGAENCYDVKSEYKFVDGTRLEGPTIAEYIDFGSDDVLDMIQINEFTDLQEQASCYLAMAKEGSQEHKMELIDWLYHEEEEHTIEEIEQAMNDRLRELGYEV